MGATPDACVTCSSYNNIIAPRLACKPDSIEDGYLPDVNALRKISFITVRCYPRVRSYPVTLQKLKGLVCDPFRRYPSMFRHQDRNSLGGALSSLYFLCESVTSSHFPVRHGLRGQGREISGMGRCSHSPRKLLEVSVNTARLINLFHCSLESFNLRISLGDGRLRLVIIDYMFGINLRDEREEI